MANRLIPADQVARMLLEPINYATSDLSDGGKQRFMMDLVEWLYKLNGFPPEGPRDAAGGGG